MPKRVLDGEAMWSSTRIASVEPAWVRGEYAWIYPIAGANGSFELDVRAIWAKCYAFSRPEITLEKTREIIDALTAAKLLFPWTSQGKDWGFWTGSDKPGRLPRASWQKRAATIGNLAPYPAKEELKAFLSNQTRVQRAENTAIACVNHADPVPELELERELEVEIENLSCPSTTDDNHDLVTDEIVDMIRRAHPRGSEDAADARKAIRKAITRETQTHGSRRAAAAFLHRRTLIFAEKVAEWPPGDNPRFVKMCSTWFNKESYLNPDSTYERQGGQANGFDRAQQKEDRNRTAVELGVASAISRVLGPADLVGTVHVSKSANDS